MAGETVPVGAVGPAGCGEAPGEAQAGIARTHPSRDARLRGSVPQGQRGQERQEREDRLTRLAWAGEEVVEPQPRVDSDQVHVLAERLLEPVRAAGVDAVVLGCTHYPLLARTIGDVMGRDVVLVSSADETAFAVRDLIGAPDVTRGTSNHLFLTSGDVETFRELGARFLGPEVRNVEPHVWS